MTYYKRKVVNKVEQILGENFIKMNSLSKIY